MTKARISSMVMNKGVITYSKNSKSDKIYSIDLGEIPGVVVIEDFIGKIIC